MVRSAWSQGKLEGKFARHAHFLQPGLAAPPFQAGGDVVRGRADHVGRAAQQIAAAVAVVIDRIVEIMRRQKLRLAEFAGPGADHFVGRQIAAVDDLQRGDGLVREHLRAAAIIGQRHQRAQRRQIAHVGAEIAFQSPERGDHRRRHAIFLFGARERRRIGLDRGLALLHPVGRGHAAGEFGEHLPEHALAAVAVDDALVVDEIRRGFRDRALRHAGGDGLLLQVGEEAVERHAVVAGGARGASALWRVAPELASVARVPAAAPTAASRPAAPARLHRGSIVSSRKIACGFRLRANSY